MTEMVEGEGEQAEAERTNILRWEDDGGHPIVYSFSGITFDLELAHGQQSTAATPGRQAAE